MPDLGTVVKVIGGVVAFAMLIVATRELIRAADKQAADLRTKLREAVNEMDLARKGIENLLDGANQSRAAVMSALGHWNGGAGEQWRKQFDADKAALRLLLVIASKDGGFEKSSPSELEVQLGGVHRLTREVRRIREKYQKCLDEDERSRRDIGARYR